MKNLIIASILTVGPGLTGAHACFAEASLIAKVRGEAAVLASSQWDLTSRANGLDYRIFIAEPVSPPPQGGYAVVYVLDGNGYFATAAEAERIQELGGEIKPALIVGIGYPVCSCDPAGGMKSIRTRRVTDFTPAAPPEKLEKIAEQMSGAPIGGADGFYRFIKEDLGPWLTRSYPIDPSDQTLFGHSLGGLFVIDTLFKHPEAFRTFVAASPVISWGDEEVLGNEAAFAAAVSTSKVAPRVLITAGGLEQTVLKIQLPPEVSPADYARSITEMRMVDNAKQLARRLGKVRAGTSGYEVKLQVFEGETHVSVVPGALSSAIGFALRVPLLP